MNSEDAAQTPRIFNRNVRTLPADLEAVRDDHGTVWEKWSEDGTFWRSQGGAKWPIEVIRNRTRVLVEVF